MGKGLILVSVFFYSTAVLGCPNGWTVNKNSCYHVSRDKASWVEAIRMCELHGGVLADISSSEEQAFIESMVQRQNGHTYWLGGSDWTTEGAWVWETTGKAISYTNWHHGQPDNSHNIEHCLYLDTQSHYRWFDRDCHDALHYICENP
ncbi:perlucin-like protein [Saccostrea cucullata]|uniref:perlucin-like protein n=1 Tax=Saccostrea cuccullata TaxID=36930 RepID=UPI002ED3243D